MSKVVLTCLTWVLALALILTRTLDPVHATLLAGCATAIILLWPGILPDIPRLPDLPHHSHPGARRDLSNLSWSTFEMDGRVTPKVQARIRALTEGRPHLDSLRDVIDETPHPTPTQVLDWLDIIVYRLSTDTDRQGEK